jgi:hypothetical protein
VPVKNDQLDSTPNDLNSMVHPDLRGKRLAMVPADNFDDCAGKHPQKKLFEARPNKGVIFPDLGFPIELGNRQPIGLPQVRNQTRDEP